LGKVLYYNEDMPMTLLLHACCAPCSVRCVEILREEAIHPDMFWYNPNIHPLTEYRARRDALTQFAGEEGLELIQDDDYGLRSFIAGLSGDFENRCDYCYRTRLERTAACAAERGYDCFSTTLLVSPYQRHDEIRRIGFEEAEKHGVQFYYRDFRPGFREGQRKARERGIYMQKYCGCIFSEEERYTKTPSRTRTPSPE
jgi:predicted adenine nucleotide alpha hydrolase (AANH) superfamily ATPase